MSKKDKVENVGAESVEAEQDIQVGDPQVLRPKELPLVVVLPENASKAQIKYAEILNSYAYQNTAKWAVKKEGLIQKLRDLKNAPDPVEENLTIGKKNTI